MICCEGNASFYEVGMMEVPIDGKIDLSVVVNVFNYLLQEGFLFSDGIILVLQRVQ